MALTQYVHKFIRWFIKSQCD